MKEAAAREPSLRGMTTATADDVSREINRLKDEVNDKGRKLLNAEQFEVVALVGKRICRELEVESMPDADIGEPLRWVLHGGPGTGKSHVIKIIKERIFQNF